MNRIYVVTTVHPANDVRIFFREIKSLLKKYPVTYLAQGSKPGKDPGLKFYSLSKDVGTKGRFSNGLLAYKYLREKRAKFIHIHDVDFMLFAPALRLLNKAKIIFDKHEFIYLTVENRNKIPKLLKPLLKWVVLLAEKILTSFADEVIVANPRQLEDDRKATLLLNVPPRENYIHEPSSKKYKRLCYVGDITLARGAKNLSKIMEGLTTEYQLSLVGNFRDKGTEKILTSYKNVSHYGYVANNKIADKLKETGCGLVPFRESSQFIKSVPSKVFDYMAMGMVVIAPIFIRESFVSLKDVQKEIIYTDGTPRGFIDIITKLEPSKASKISKINRELFLKKYNWASEEEKLLKLYEKISKE